MKNWKRKVNRRKRRRWSCHLTTSHNYTTKMNNIKRNYTRSGDGEARKEPETQTQQRPIGGIKQKGPEAENKGQKATEGSWLWPMPVLCIIFHDRNPHNIRMRMSVNSDDMSCRLTVALLSATWECNCSRLISPHISHYSTNLAVAAALPLSRPKRNMII